MSNIYTKERQAAQPISVLSSIDVERAKRRRETIAYREGTGVSGRIAGRHTHASERKVVRDLRILTEQKKPKKILSSSSIGGTYFFVFVGEWGYEILSSHGWLRKLKYEHPEIRIGVASRSGVKFLYEDACDIYVDITDVLANYKSSMFGLRLTEEDKKVIEDRCLETVDGKYDGISYSNTLWNHYGITYGHPGGKANRMVRSPEFLDRQLWRQLTLKGLETEKREIEKTFPDLLSSDYIIVQDRYREAGWGRESYSISIWKVILDYLVSIGYHPVLIGYKHWKLQDARSIFVSKEFKDIPGILNITDFLTDHLGRNLAYQAILFKHAQFWLGIWGSASMLAPLLGVKSYVLSAARGKRPSQERDESVWNETFKKCGGSLEYIDTLLTEESVISQLESKKLSSQSSSVSYPIVKDKKNHVAVFNLCWNRLHYTKYCFNNLWEKAGMDFDHFVVDNGSTDGTEEWLLKNRHRFKGIIRNEKNLGVGNAIIQMVMVAREKGYDWFILSSNDIEILTDGFIEKMYKFWGMTKGNYLFSPIIDGITHTIKILETKRIEDYNVDVVDVTGAVYMACSISLLADYLASVDIWRANNFCRFAAKRGIKNLHLTDLKVTHYETTAGQMKRYPNMRKGYYRDIDENLKFLLSLKMKKRPFMSFITRCYKRPKKLEQCIASINNQTDKDFEHIFIEDDVGMGLEWANKQLYEHCKRVRGKYVYICDDDDQVSDKNFVASIKKIVQESLPDVIITKMLREGKEFPTPDVWNKDPIKKEIGTGCICVMNKVFQKHIEAFGKSKFGDYYYIKEIFEERYKTYWLDKIVMVGMKGHGRPEI